MKIHRVIAMYEKIGDALLGKIDISEIPLEFLIKMFIPIDDPYMYDCYPLNKEQFLDLVKVAPQIAQIDLDTVDAFCECYYTDN